VLRACVGVGAVRGPQKYAHKNAAVAAGIAGKSRVLACEHAHLLTLNNNGRSGSGLEQVTSDK
jgi:hypothetical protein